MNELRQTVGQEMPLDRFHLLLRRAASAVPGVSSYGSCLVSCADERMGVVRSSFERDVAIPLISDVANARDRVFSIANLCGRLEPGAFALVDNHFLRPAVRGKKLLIVEIASHVGRIKSSNGHAYGEIDRFGQLSPCCGALTALLNPRGATGAVRHPWFEQLNSFFGPVRLAALRQMDPSTRMIAAAIVHAGLQAESAIAEVFQDLPETTTDVLIISGVAVNQQWSDGFLPVSWHHIGAEGGKARSLTGFSLRTTPEALDIDISGARIRVEGGQKMEASPRVERRTVADEPGADLAADIPALHELEEHHREELDRRLDALHPHIERLREDPAAWRSYSRPILRALFRGVCIVQPEVGVAAMLYEGGEKILAAHKLKQVLAHGPSTILGRRALHDIEAELQQLNHEDAQQVLETLLASRK